MWNIKEDIGIQAKPIIGIDKGIETTPIIGIDKGIGENSNLAMDKGIQVGPTNANFDPFDKKNSPISNTISYGEPLRNYPDWTIYSKKDPGIQTSLIDHTMEDISLSPNIIAPSPIDSYGTNPNTQGLAPFDSSSQRAGLIDRSNSDSSGITINIESPIREISPIDSIIEESILGMPGGFPPAGAIPAEGEFTPLPSIQSTEPLRVLPHFGIEGISRLPLPDSASPSGTIPSSIEISPEKSNSSISSSAPFLKEGGEPIIFTKGRFAPLSLNIGEPFSDTPIVTPESMSIPQDISIISTEPLRVSPHFGIEGIDRLPLPEPGPSSISPIDSKAPSLDKDPSILSSLNYGLKDRPPILFTDPSQEAIRGIVSDRLIGIEDTSLPSPSTAPLRVLPPIGPANIALPESGPSTEISISSPIASIREPVLNTNNRFALLSLNVSEPFSDTPILTPESSIDSNPKK